MQALLFAALLANARAHVDGDRVFRAGGRRCCSACCCSCGSTPCSAIAGVARRPGARRCSTGSGPRASFVAVVRRRALRRRAATCWARCAPMRILPDRVSHNLPLVAVRACSALLALAAAWPLIVAGARAATADAGVVRRAAARDRGAVVAAGAATRCISGIRPESSRPTTPTRCARSPTCYLTLPALLAALIGFGARRPAARSGATRRSSSTVVDLLAASSSTRSGSCPSTSG